MAVFYGSETYSCIKVYSAWQVICQHMDLPDISAEGKQPRYKPCADSLTLVFRLYQNILDQDDRNAIAYRPK